MAKSLEESVAAVLLNESMSASAMTGLELLKNLKPKELEKVLTALGDHFSALGKKAEGPDRDKWSNLARAMNTASRILPTMEKY